MGHRLHSAIKYEVKYGDCAFNYAQPHINPIIEVLAEGDSSYEGEFLDYADTLSASREKLVKNVEYIKVTESDWEGQEDLNELIEYMEDDDECDIDREYLYKQLKHIINQSDENNDYVHFAWF
jgi:hypothetical protein